MFQWLDLLVATYPPKKEGVYECMHCASQGLPSFQNDHILCKNSHILYRLWYFLLPNRRPGSFINFGEKVLQVELIRNGSFINFGKKFCGSCIPYESIYTCGPLYILHGKSNISFIHINAFYQISSTFYTALLLLHCIYHYFNNSYVQAVQQAGVLQFWY